MTTQILRSLFCITALALASRLSAGEYPGAHSVEVRSDKLPGVPAKPGDQPARHPLKGVVLDIRTDRGALVVKHEEIPGVMRAMTMLLKVDEATLKAAKKDQAVTGLLVRKSDGWWLEEAKLAP